MDHNSMWDYLISSDTEEEQKTILPKTQRATSSSEQLQQAPKTQLTSSNLEDKGPSATKRLRINQTRPSEMPVARIERTLRYEQQAPKRGVTFRLPDATIRTAGQKLQHVMNIADYVLGLSPGLVVFKFGITMQPLSRWELYKKIDKGDFEHMFVLLETTTSEAVSYVEAAVIHKYSHIAGCRNIALGGEGVAHGTCGPYFCYVVFRILARTPPAVIVL